MTPGNTDIPGHPKAIVCATASNITIVALDNADGEAVTFTDVPAGFVAPLVVRRVTAATATVLAVLD